MEIFFIGILILIFAAIMQLFFKNQYAKLNLISVSSVLSALCVVYNSIKIFLEGSYAKTFPFSSIRKWLPTTIWKIRISLFMTASGRLTSLKKWRARLSPISTVTVCLCLLSWASAPTCTVCCPTW